MPESITIHRYKYTYNKKGFIGISLILLEYLIIYRNIFIKYNSSLCVSILCLASISVLWLLLMVSLLPMVLLVGLQCVTVVLPDHTLFLVCASSWGMGSESPGPSPSPGSAHSTHILMTHLL